MPNITPDLIAKGFLWYVAFLFSTTCHEASHALVAKMGGDETAALGGQVSLNPVPHIRRSPWGMVVIPIIAFFAAGYMIGWASAPYDPHWERRHPHRAAWMALAGPAANFSLMLLAALLLRIGFASGFVHINPYTGAGNFAWTILYAFFALNLLLGVFNLIPAPPLDGSSGIMVLMSESQAQRYLDWLRGNNYSLVGLLLAILVFRYIYGPIEGVVTRFLLFHQF
jgi:Zn-dependent protease